MAETIKFWLDGCDICFIAEAPADITLKELLTLCDRIEPLYCACGLKSFLDTQCRFGSGDPEIVFTKTSVRKTNEEDISCTIHDDDQWYRDKYK